MAAHHAPATASELAEIITDAAGRGAKLEVRGGGSKADVGAPREAEILSTENFSGIIDYDPAELVLTLGPATRLSEVEDMLAGAGQMLAFEPFDHGRMLGKAPGSATVGGVIAAGVAGSRRVSAGGARDHLLGFEAVSGRGESFVGGAKVVKNVTGYDLPKVMAGSWGRLAVFTQLTLKVLPSPRAVATLVLGDLSNAGACAAMARALGSQAEVAAAAHVPAGTEDRKPITAFRLEGFATSVEARAKHLAIVLQDFGKLHRLDYESGANLWTGVRNVTPVKDDRPLWRISAPPMEGARIVDAIGGEAKALLDWAGGLVWLATNAAPEMVRGAAQAAGGHASLIRAPEAVRAKVPFQAPPTPGVAALSARVRRSFDPLGVFETGRFLDEPHAN